MLFLSHKKESLFLKVKIILAEFLEMKRVNNPILQNKTHVKWSRNYVGEEIPLFSIIVFSERWESFLIHMKMCGTIRI